MHSNSKKNLVLKVVGPNQKVVLQKKKKIFGMWTWNKTGEFSYPSLFHYYTNNKNNEIDFEIKKDLVDNIKLIGKDDDNLKKELIEKKMSLKLFMIKNNSFQELNKQTPSFFKIPIKLPYNSPAGKYFISLSLMKSGSKIETERIELLVEKPGISSLVFKFAHKFSFIYGIFSAIIAIGLGLMAGIIFRKISLMEKEITFLVIVDESPEMYKALRYAAQRSSRNNGRVALLYTFDTLEFSHWKAVEDIAEAESREKAESKIKDVQTFLLEFNSKKPKKFIMKGDRIECITNFLKENKFISNLVLASSSEKSSSDPLINAFTGKFRSSLSVPLTIIPQNLSEEEIDKLSSIN